MLVPLIVRYRVGIVQDEYTWKPGPATSTCPPDPGSVRAEKNAVSSCWFRAPTAMMYGLFAGAPTKPGSPLTRSALFPAAAMMSVPRFRALRPAIVYGGWTSGTSAPRDMEITAQPWPRAQSIPARMPASDPDPSSPRTLPASDPAPSSPRTLPAKTSAWWATP